MTLTLSSFKFTAKVSTNKLSEIKSNGACANMTVLFVTYKIGTLKCLLKLISGKVYLTNE